jgi:KaiC/GvpD/RAD55 family RecA-like ATPase
LVRESRRGNLSRHQFLGYVCLVVVIMSQSLWLSAGQSRQHAIITVLKNPIVIDGKWTSNDEWTDASELPLKSSSGDTLGYLRIKHDNSSLYLLADISAKSELQGSGCDQTAPVVDTAWILFDPGGSAGFSLSSSQIAFSITGDVAHGVACNHNVWKGSESGWNVIGTWSSSRPWQGSIERIASLQSSYDPYSSQPHVAIEARITWPMIGLQSSNPFGFMFYFFSNGNVDFPQISWPIDGSSNSPASWGDLVLSGSVTTASSTIELSQITTTSVAPTTTTVSPISSVSTAALQSAGSQLGNLGWVAIGAVFAVVAVFLIVLRKRKPSQSRLVQHETAGGSAVSAISTGYPDFDHILAGGFPEGYVILILSASWDERDLLLRRIIKSCVQSGRATFYVTNDVRTTNDLVRTYQKDFYAYSPYADRIPSPYKNIRQIPSVGNLSEFTISLATDIRETSSIAGSKVLIIDVLSDILMRHKTTTTIRWASDFFAKRKAEGFTIIATLNPSIEPKEAQPLSDLFDGVIEIYEKALGERTRRFLTIKKMHGRKYIDEDLLLDRNKLF